MKEINKWYDGFHTHVTVAFEGDIYGQLTVKLDGDKHDSENTLDLAQETVYKTLFADKYQNETINKLSNELDNTLIALAEVFELLTGGV